MFHAKMNDEEDDELPAYEEEEEGQEQPSETIEVEEIVIEEEPDEEEAAKPAAPASRKSAPARKIGSSGPIAPSSSPPSRLEWASTKPTSAMSITTTPPRVWKTIRRRSDARAATAKRRSAKRSCAPTI